MEVASAIQESQLDAGCFGETGVALHLCQSVGVIGLGESMRGLVDELQSVTADLEGA